MYGPISENLRLYTTTCSVCYKRVYSKCTELLSVSYFFIWPSVSSTIMYHLPNTSLIYHTIPSLSDPFLRLIEPITARRRITLQSVYFYTHVIRGLFPSSYNHLESRLYLNLNKTLAFLPSTNFTSHHPSL